MQENKTTILVVEDDDGIRTLLATILRINGYDAIAFSDGHEALDHLRDSGLAIQLLITDVHLGPYLDGLELAHGLRAFYPSLRVLYISGLDERTDLLHEIDVGRAFFLPKPFKPKMLIETVAAILKPAMSILPIGTDEP